MGIVKSNIIEVLSTTSFNETTPVYTTPVFTQGIDGVTFLVDYTGGGETGLLLKVEADYTNGIFDDNGDSVGSWQENNQPPPASEWITKTKNEFDNTTSLYIIHDEKYKIDNPGANISVKKSFNVLNNGFIAVRLSILAEGTTTSGQTVRVRAIPVLNHTEARRFAW